MVIKYWTKEEIKFLKENYKTISYKNIANLLHRSHDAVKKKIGKLSLKKTDWTTEEVVFLRKNYKILSIKDMAKKLGRTYNSVQLKAGKLNLCSSSKKWTEEEIKFLKKNYKIIPTKNIAEKFGRTIDGIQLKAGKLNLSSTVKYWTEEEVEFLRNNYKTMECMDIAKKLGWSVIAIQRKCSKIGLKKGHNWGIKETKFLKENYNIMSYNDIANTLGWSDMSIRNKAHWLGLKREPTPSWCKGLTKEKDKRIARRAKEQGKTRKKLHKEGKIKLSGCAILNKNEDFIKKRLKCLNIKPNKPETFLINLFKENNIPFHYVGDGKLIVDGKCPDFVCNPSKKVILMHGDWWHYHKPKKKNPDLTREQVEKKDIAHYRANFFDCLIIWEHELKNPTQVVNKINEFIGGNK